MVTIGIKYLFQPLAPSQNNEFDHVDHHILSISMTAWRTLSISPGGCPVSLPLSQSKREKPGDAMPGLSTRWGVA
jgi:hypothetical protein